MKTLLRLAFLLCCVQVFQAQNNSDYRIISSNLGVAGSSQTIETSRGTYKVSQSIGQSSIIGTYKSNGYYLRQGYQQPLTGATNINNLSTTEISAKVYPNPFSRQLNIVFTERIQSDISVLIFDINGRLIYNQNFEPRQDVEIQIENISKGTYFLKVASKRKRFNTKLIKI
ncbi:T9SS type A sorting domain-containing protein [Winogradskyella jejuensis]|uniref:Por secretion system C-terminal sorting domain-containing protein n=1 Tax=Winogradskyella jejuensis TaxID=1089305 RepID=A0A1M5SBB3_9FLAO|nr:T9SS type A sorting domain-containing protein [Winogradskyella jejuensis]SHH35578.1 Por secretion system C-terminal sorting domain-containing protein [Winogradskyella jejuensis]